jgi:hypothetical protein
MKNKNNFINLKTIIMFKKIQLSLKELKQNKITHLFSIEFSKTDNQYSYDYLFTYIADVNLNEKLSLSPIVKNKTVFDVYNIKYLTNTKDVTEIFFNDNDTANYVKENKRALKSLRLIISKSLEKYYYNDKNANSRFYALYDSENNLLIEFVYDEKINQYIILSSIKCTMSNLIKKAI